ncbi:MAG: DUF1816 domain-containing protein [Leptolyngbyaceae cyanobacterium MO_188.B28]|nr:DUF1816 domain-containing protein [Leptolyngbyaceae cyanobacterium MO_188.B28]
MKNFFGSLVNFVGKEWWVEISTDSPKCVYYFGPFVDQAEADSAKRGYIEDLEREGAQQIRVDVKRCKTPTELTIYDESNDSSNSLRSFPTPVLSGQS